MAYNILGTDVSFYQDAPTTAQRIDFKEMKQNGVFFTIVRAGQDGRGEDRDFKYNVVAAHEAGLLVGTYYVINTKSTGTVQAENYWKIISPYSNIIDLPPVADYEYYHWATPRPSKATAKNMLGAFLLKLQSLSGKTPMIYTNADTWYQYGGTDTYFASYPLWQASYSSVPPKPFAPFTKWTFWQFSATGNGQFYGVESKSIDLNYFYGTLEELYKFCGKIPEVPTPDECCDYCKETRQRLEDLEKKVADMGADPNS
jgi:lysozyme